MAKISSVMEKAMIIEEDLTLEQAAKIMGVKNVTSLIVTKDDKISGIISHRDILKNISNLGKRVSNIMSRRVFTISDDKTTDDALRIMLNKKIKSLPVIKDDKLVGIIRLGDIIEESNVSVSDLGEFFIN